MDAIAISVKKTANTLDVSEPTVYRLVRAGKLKKIKIGCRSLIVTESIRSLVAAA